MVEEREIAVFDDTEAFEKVFESENAGIFGFEHQLRKLFIRLQDRYEGVFFSLESETQPFDNTLISQEESNTLFKIAEEAIDNCLRHSRASSIKAEVKLISDHLIQFSVFDNGVGFSLDKVAETKKHSGFKRICDFARQLDARVVFDSTPGRGTLVVIAKQIKKQKARFYTRLIASF